MRRRIPRSAIKVGMKVTCKEAVEAYYSKDGQVMFNPGDVGIVGDVNVPCVRYTYRKNGGTATFVCVDFQRGDDKWRCSLYYTNIKVIHEEE